MLFRPIQNVSKLLQFRDVFVGLLKKIGKMILPIQIGNIFCIHMVTTLLSLLADSLLFKKVVELLFVANNRLYRTAIEWEQPAFWSKIIYFWLQILSDQGLKHWCGRLSQPLLRQSSTKTAWKIPNCFSRSNLNDRIQSQSVFYSQNYP